MLVENLIVNLEQRLWHRCRFIVICIEEAWETGGARGVIGLRARESSERRAVGMSAKCCRGHTACGLEGGLENPTRE